jgi:arylamine N-acetyltransferase
MNADPLARPTSNDILHRFLAHYRMPKDLPPRRMLAAVARAFARLPYENLTKIIKAAETGNPAQARRGPAEVIADHRTLGTGGTCFSLTAAFLHLVRSLGWEAEPILADRSYGTDTHCALLVRIDGLLQLLDPGYLIVEPIRLDIGTCQELKTPFNRLILAPHADGGKLDLSTVQDGRRTHRLTFKLSPVDTSEFLKAWDASFDWEMMHYPLLTRVANSRHLYLKGSRFQVRSEHAVELSEVPQDELAARIEADFGIAPSIAARAALHTKTARRPAWLNPRQSNR